MHEQDFAVLEALVPVAWADGSFGERERELFSELVSAYDPSEADRAKLLAFANQRRTLDDINLTNLSFGDRRIVLHHAALMVHADGNVDPEETKMLQALAQRLNVPSEEFNQLHTLAIEHLKAHKG
jgi:tellurite resistance protein